ncbi:hypothetical protein [Streptomyces sp. 049-1]|uniref:hypothetical protein n=1 Tax=Streptomyces sp. 049-1 TaxID=2789264 RepID=UPI003980511E
MITAPAPRPAYLPPGTVLDLVAVDSSWNAVTVPVLWGHLVLDVLADRSGPVMQDENGGHLLWIIPPGSADAWPDARTAGVELHREGSRLLVCGLEGYRAGMRWLRVPTTRQRDTDARLLRLGLEWVLGPLAEAQAIQVCVSCGAPTRDGRLLARSTGLAGPGLEVHACPSCWREIASGSPGRHLRVVRQGPH